MHLGIRTISINLLKRCNSNTKCVAKVQEEFSDQFKTCEGLKTPIHEQVVQNLVHTCSNDLCEPPYICYVFIKY